MGQYAMDMWRAVLDIGEVAAASPREIAHAPEGVSFPSAKALRFVARMWIASAYQIVVNGTVRDYDVGILTHIFLNSTTFFFMMASLCAAVVSDVNGTLPDRMVIGAGAFQLFAIACVKRQRSGIESANDVVKV